MAEDAAGLKVSVTSIEDKLEGLTHRLLSNGQPGWVTVLDSRVSSLERYKAWVLGSAAGVAGVVRILAWIVMATK